MKRFNRLTVQTALLIAGTIAPIVAFSESDPAYSQLSRELVSAHIPFANPYCTGRVKALVIAPTMTQRETVELAQRLSLEYVPLMVNAYEQFGPYEGASERDYGGIAPEEFKADIDRKLAADAEYDLIIVGKIKWDSMPVSVRDRILAKIRQGTGLLYVGPWGKLDPDLGNVLAADEAAARFITRGVPPLDLLPRFKTGRALPLVLSGDLGDGRIIALDYGESDSKAGVPAHRRDAVLECLTPFQSDDVLYYEYWHSLLARACLWSARKESAVQLSAPAAGVLTFRQDELGTKPVSLTLTGKLPAEPCFLHWLVRDRYNQLETVQTAPLSGNAIALVLPYLKGGEKVLDVWVRDSSARVLDWYSVALVIQPAIEIRAIAIAKDVLQKEEPLTGTITLSALLAEKRSLKLTVMDTLNRIVHSSLLPMSGKSEAGFSVTMKNPLVRGYTLIAQIAAGDRIIDEKRTFFYINTTDFNRLAQDFTFHIWDGPKPNCRGTQIWLQEFQKHGIDTIYQAAALFESPEQSAQIARTIARANLAAAPYATRLALSMEQYAHAKSEEGPDGPMIPAERNPLTKSLDELRPKLQQIQNLARIYGPFGPLYYSLGDENALCTPPYKDIDFSEQSQESFRGYVKEAYATLDALNQEWGTDYKSWGEVKPITFANAAKLNRYPQWLDHRMHMDKLFTEYNRVNSQAIREIDPLAKIGMEGPVYPSSSYTGFNLYEMLADFQYFTPYPHVPEIHTFSFLPPGAIRGTWIGSYEGNPVEYIRYMPWHMLFEGANSISWWHSGLGGASGIPGLRGCSPDLLPQPQLKRTGEEIKDIKAGVGKLLITAERVISPIGVYYANPCLHASTIRAKETTWEQSLQDFHYALRDAGFDYRFLTPPAMVAGEWKKYRAIILPYSQAISPREATLFKTFVQEGGLLVADFVPGIMDEHGKMLEKSSLSELFGEFKRLQTNAVGKGKAVYLADYLRGYATQRAKGLSRGVCDGLIRLLGELAGIQPYAAVKDEQGNTRQDMEISKFRSGDADYLACLRLFAGKSSEGGAGAEGQSAAGISGKSSSTANLTLFATRNVYEVRSHADLGKQQTVQTEFAPGQANVYALLPAAVEGLQVATSKKEYTPGETVPVSGAILPAALGNCGMVVRLSVTQEGNRLDHYATTIAYRGNFDCAIPLALNERAGRYTVTVADVVSGKTASTEFVVIGKTE